ncbi:MAG: calcium/sodium antiporter [Methanomicrobiales archaeon]|jgi:cation:H+ antiporter|nr:calcium/sodium antiporter [Methanomicrobiales archaeon]
MILLLITFIVGVLILLKCADIFVDGASTLATRFGVSSIIIGLTVVAFGTSLPELVVSTGAAIAGNANIALGNVIGSNVFNIAFILALCSVLAPQVWNKEQQKEQIQGIILMFVATAVFIVLSLNGIVSHIDAGILLLVFAAALFTIWRLSKKRDDFDNREKTTEPVKGYRDIWMTILGLAGVIVGAQMVVSSAEQIALLLGVSDFIIGITIVAIGTSLPELVTSVVAVLKGEFAISVGNILGSNLFNALAIVGASAAILPLNVPGTIDLVFLAIFTVAVLPFLTGRAFITRAWGGVFLIGYLGYILYYVGFFGF